MSDLRERLARRLCAGVPDVECDHIDGVTPWCEREVDALLPVVTEAVQRARADALRDAAAMVVNQRDGYLVSPGLDHAWRAGWHSASDHHARRLRAGAEAEVTQ